MNWKINISVVLLIVLFFRSLLERGEFDENQTIKFIRKSGYQGEEHHVVTQDGYILGLQRITDDKKGISKRVVLINHCLESSSLEWLYHQQANSLPYLLFEAGYDVWLANVRGTLTSYNHTTWNPHKEAEKFWNFSFHEIGYYDLPAMIDYILEVTRQKKLSYIGMSQGEATFLIMTSTRPEYNAKINIAALTAASSHLRHSDNTVFKILGKYWYLIQKLYEVLGVQQTNIRDLIGSLCRYRIMSPFCLRLSNFFFGYRDDDQVNTDTIVRASEMYPSRSSMKQVIHYLQLYNSGVFRHFDYGTQGNLVRYGSSEPPLYDLKKITCPVAYFWGENDCWARPKDIVEVTKKLPNSILSYRIPHDKFNHHGVMTAKNARTLLYDKIVEVVRKYN